MLSMMPSDLGHKYTITVSLHGQEEASRVCKVGPSDCLVEK